MIHVTFLFTLTSNSIILHRDHKHLMDNYHLWGPSARTCMSLTNPKRLQRYEQLVASAVDRFVENHRQFSFLNTASLLPRLFTVQPTHGSRQQITVKFAIDHVL